MTITGESRPDALSPPLDPIPLPPAAPGERARRRHEQDRVRRLRWLVAAVLVVAFAVTVGLVAGGRDHGPKSGRAASLRGSPAVPAGPAPALLAGQRSDGRADWVAAVVPALSGRGGDLVLIPTGTMTEIPSLGLEPIGLSLAAGGSDRLLSATENMLGAPLGAAAVLDGASLTELAATAGAVTVEVPGRVEDVQPDGRVSVLYEAGANRVEPTDVPLFFSARGRGSDLSRLARHAAYWQSWLTRMRRPPTTASPSLERSPAYRALAAVAAGSFRVRVLPVQSAGALDDGAEAYQLDKAETARLVAAVFGGRAAAARPRVRVLNGTGEVELAQKVAKRLVPAGMQITLTGNASPLGQRETQIVYYDPKTRPVAERIRGAMGVGILVHNRNATDVVDVTVIVGKDFNSEDG